jgi:hypothetical protein
MCLKKYTDEKANVNAQKSYLNAKLFLYLFNIVMLFRF